MATILEQINDGLDLVEAVGSLYTSLDDDSVPALAEHLEEMKTVQGQVGELQTLVKALVDEKTELENKLAEAKKTNTELMYNQLKNETEKKADEETEPDVVDKVNEAVSNISLEED